MANIERNGILKVKNGNDINILYPLTKIDNVYGLKQSLADIIDGGPKQLLQFNDSTTGNLIATVQSDGYTVKITGGSDTTGRTVYYGQCTINKTGYYKFAVELSGTGASCILYDSTVGAIIKEFYQTTNETFTLTAGHTYSIRTYRKGSNTNALVSAMLCTLNDWNVSENFVRHRPSYQELYDRIVALENR